MKVKRIIKSFIYLFPVYFVLFCALGVCFASLSDNAIHLDREVTSNNTTTYEYSTFNYDENSPVRVAMSQFNLIIGYDIDGNLFDSVYTLIGYFGLVDNEGTLFAFVGCVIVYEIIAIMVCAVLDVIFLIPEFYNKIEDKYIKGGKKRE